MEDERPLAEFTQKMMEEQSALGDTVENTAALMRFMLQMANQNLLVMRDQLLEIQRLAREAKEKNDTAPNH